MMVAIEGRTVMHDGDLVERRRLMREDAATLEGVDETGRAEVLWLWYWRGWGDAIDRVRTMLADDVQTAMVLAEKARWDERRP